MATPANLLLTVAIAFVAVLCADAPQQERTPGVSRDGLSPTGGDPSRAQGRKPLPTLTITLRPRVRPSPGVAVIYELSGRIASRVRSLGMAPSTATSSGPDSIRYLLVRDAEGLVDIARNPKTGRFHLQRQVKGQRLRVSYLAESATLPGRLDLNVQDAEISGVGYGFLALPELDARLAVHLEWQLDAVQASRAATSFAVGEDVVTIAKPLELAHSFYLAGPLAVLEDGGGQRLVTLGEPAFDRAQALQFCSAALRGARSLFDPSDGQPFTFVLMPRPGLGTHYDGAALHRSFAIWFDHGRPLDTRLRLLVAHELTHHWIGGQLRFTDEKGEDAKWFSEGFTVHFARAILWREGLLSAEEYLEDIQRDLTAQRRAFALQAQHKAEQDLSLPLHHASPAYYRGALYAARLDAQLRGAGQGGLRALLSSLFVRARRDGPALPESVWREQLVEALGPTGDLEFDQLVVLRSEPIELPAGALGPCFQRVPRRHAVFELGFDAASLRDEPPLVRGLVVGSAAERAGLRNGQRILLGAEVLRQRSAPRKVKLVVADEQGRKRVSYRPRRVIERGQWRVAGRASCREATERYFRTP